MLRTMIALCAFATGCRTIEAPTTLEELVVFGFVHHEEDGYSQAMAEELIPLAEQKYEELTEGYSVNSLTNADLTAAGVDGGDVEDIIGALGGVTYTHDIDEVLTILTATDKTLYYPNVSAYEVVDETDRQCFLDHDCETLEQTISETTEVTILGNATRTYTNQFRWIEVEGVGTGLVVRSLNPEGVTFDTDIAVVYQQYALYTMYPSDQGARRIESFWVDAEFIGLEVPENYAVNSAVDTMADGAETVDAALDAM